LTISGSTFARHPEQGRRLVLRPHVDMRRTGITADEVEEWLRQQWDAPDNPGR
jgi:hypothetical protein